MEDAPESLDVVLLVAAEEPVDFPPADTHIWGVICLVVNS